MGNLDDTKRKHGRLYDQITHDGTGNAGSVGTGGTGDLDRSLEQGNQQSAGRTDDRLSGGPEHTTKGFRDPADLQTGTGGTGSQGKGAGSGQGERGGSMQSDRAAKDEVPRSDARVSHKSDRGT